MAEQDWVLVGLMHGPHGVRGLIKVESLSDNPARFALGRMLYACLPGREPQTLTIEGVTPHQGRLLVSFAEVHSREAAAAWLGAELKAEPDAAPLPPGQYYHYQLLGLPVYQQGQKLGEIMEILRHPANDVYVIKDAADEEIWLPALKSVIKNIDLKERRLEVELPEGL